ncbi:hypothetical protein FNH22_03215 [Fulvivirga sp. M361]|uniref:hypothetical protein n=1 Tax=Fulvivirga sp. M361 TaxID=2594266 RepID=UPI001179D77E|nr:hypothetical protein [Fulvivirga sp. M361]TRX61802.1 hypothetical protein FNH22_03215 [Fulvivirga sp. M361]
MSKTKSDALFQLIKSLKKSEKRYFKLQSRLEDPNTKYLMLFDQMDSQTTYNEREIIQAVPGIKAQQLSNLKAHLYKKVLQCIRQYNQSAVMDIQIREMIDHAQILFNRSLYDQCVEMLKKAKKRAKKIDNLELQLVILKWEKNILTQTIGPDNETRVNRIIEEVKDVSARINNINKFTNLSAQLNSIYTKIGFIRNQTDLDTISGLFNSQLPKFNEDELSPNEKLNLYNLYVGYYFFLQDFEKGHQYAEKGVQLFDSHKELRYFRVEGYLNAINSLMIAQYKRHEYHSFVDTSRRLREIRHYPKNLINENIRLKLLKYTYVHEFNRIFMLGEFSSGVSLMNKIKPRLEYFITQLDNHSKIILYYKVACLYFGNDNYRESIQWLNRITYFENIDLREDIHSFARILNLISHYELGNMDVIDYYIRSTYRFMLKKDDLHRFQKAILNFLRKLAGEFTEEDLIPEFQKLRKRLLPMQNNPFEKRAFIYFDIISWLESKIQKERVQDVIAEKARKTLERQQHEKKVKLKLPQ